MYDVSSFAGVIAVFAAALLSVLTEWVPIGKKWWREDLDKNYPPEEADTIRLAVQVALVVLATALAYGAAYWGYIPGGVPGHGVVVPAMITVVMGVLANQGAFLLQTKWLTPPRKR